MMTDLRDEYTKPATRLSGHLAGYDPAKAPTFVWPERLKRVKAEIAAKVKARNAAALNASPSPPPPALLTPGNSQQ